MRANVHNVLHRRWKGMLNYSQRYSPQRAASLLLLIYRIRCIVEVLYIRMPRIKTRINHQQQFSQASLWRIRLLQRLELMLGRSVKVLRPQQQKLITAWANGRYFLYHTFLCSFNLEINMHCGWHTHTHTHASQIMQTHKALCVHKFLLDDVDKIMKHQLKSSWGESSDLKSRGPTALNHVFIPPIT